jgi:hypothetical protein
MTILEALKKVKEKKGALVIRNPIKRGQKALTFLPF